MDDNGPHPGSIRYVRSRIANACDGCKARKVKCDGKLPCGYCAGRRRPETCHYSQQRRRKTTPQSMEATSHGHSVRSTATTPQSPTAAESPLRTRSRASSGRMRSRPGDSPAKRTDGRQGHSMTRNDGETGGSGTQTDTANDMASGIDASAEDETEVPREARLLYDAHGKLIFIGDCAPLSFFQSVRQLVTNKVAQNAFAPQTSRYSVLENAPLHTTRRTLGRVQLVVTPEDVGPAVASYRCTTASMVDLFNNERLMDDLCLWANLDKKPDDIASVVNYLVLAIGKLNDDEELSQRLFEHARDEAYGTLSGNFGTGTVQAFTLITVYMLCSCQINGAFLFFGIAVRAAYSIGVHRTEVNARFGSDIHRQRDRLWKSIRTVDLFLSISMGRPPATSDVDCTVSYRSLEGDGNEAWDLLNASVQILLITEVIVSEVYSRRKISLQLTEGISRQLREWSTRWLRQLKDVIAQPSSSEAQAVGSCQVLSSYYYAVMLVSRPFLMYEMFRRLNDDHHSPAGRPSLASGRTKLADACIDAASLMVDSVLDLIDRNAANTRCPLLVSWLFASSLVLGVGLLGEFGRILEKYTRMSIRALDHFAKADGHAEQYSLIAQSLLTTALEHLESSELRARMRRTESSSQLFGLIPSQDRDAAGGSSPSQGAKPDRAGAGFGMRSPPTTTATPSSSSANRVRESLDRMAPYNSHHPDLHRAGVGSATTRLDDIDSAFFGLSESLLQTPYTDYWNGGLGTEADADAAAALNLFPLLEAGGGIDLAHYL